MRDAPLGVEVDGSAAGLLPVFDDVGPALGGVICIGVALVEVFGALVVFGGVLRVVLGVAGVAGFTAVLSLELVVGVGTVVAGATVVGNGVGVEVVFGCVGVLGAVWPVACAVTLGS